ncbi:MAG: GH92 family glycosyl hydrolase [Candidatus Alcyoniella australis]|nr:GH92 family glycosyl hydrolase [Candidatus Alcyoniella australis]
MAWGRKLLLIVMLIALLSACADLSDADHDDQPDDDQPDDDQSDDDQLDDDDDQPDLEDLTALVDPLMGTSGDHGQLHPAASYPFGMVKLGPDTLVRGHSGYDFRINIARGFSHTRINGVGCSGAGADLLLLPLAGSELQRLAVMDKAGEQATPGFYSVGLESSVGPIDVELCVAAHSGLHRYTFPADVERSLLIVLDQPLNGPPASFWQPGPGADEIHGMLSGANVCGEGRYSLFFSARFSEPYVELEPLDGDANLRVWFAPSAQPLRVEVGLSSVDVDSARAQRDAELNGLEFEELRESARLAWNELLHTAYVEGDDNLRRLFYTMLYRSLLYPADVTDSAGIYRGTDGELHQATDHRHYHGWSLWDTHRTKYPLISLLDPRRYSDLARSLVELYVQGKADWSTDHEPYPNVRTEHSAALLLDARRKGLLAPDELQQAYDAILSEVEGLEFGTPDSRLESSFDLWAAAQIAEDLGHDVERDALLAQAAQYESTWNEHFKVMGDDADTVHARGLYEGTLWQYRWAVPHDVAGIIELDGGPQQFLDDLIHFFEQELYNQGNEPDIHAPFLFHYAGAPWRSQRLVRSLLCEKVNQWYGTHEKWSAPYHGRIFRLDPEGMIPEMDDDAGTMSAWFALAALGLYQVTVGEPVYLLGAPIFPRVSLRPRNSQDEFVIEARGLSVENVYIQSATLDSEPLSRAWLTYDQIAAGGELILQMGPEPNLEWGAAPADLPPATFE